MSRHSLATGETGSGKTKSVVMPLTKSIIDYNAKEDDLTFQAGILIIDPKHELKDQVATWLEQKNQNDRLSNDNVKYDYFEGVDKKSWDEISDEFMNLLTKVDSHKQSNENQFWSQQFIETVMGVVELDFNIWSISNDLSEVKHVWSKILPEDIKYDEVNYFKFILDLLLLDDKRLKEFINDLNKFTYAPEKHEDDLEKKAVNTIIKFMECFDSGYPKDTYQSIAESIARSLYVDDKGNYIFNNLIDNIDDESKDIRESAEYIGEILTALLCDDDTDLIVFFKPVCNYLDCKFKNKNSIAPDKDLNLEIPQALKSYACLDDRTKSNVMASLLDCRILQKPKLYHSLNFCPCPFVDDNKFVNITDEIAKGKIIILQPDMMDKSKSSELLAKLIKAKFIQAGFRKNKSNKGKRVPFAYICDEFHKFITFDNESGEHNLLDTCRAYRGICILATQSIASLKSAPGMNDEVINVILNNGGNKFFLRNTDSDTTEKLKNLLPEPPNVGEKYPNIITVRPMISLEPGETYYMLANGKWGRAKIKLS